jgi:hypothetical protein
VSYSDAGASTDEPVVPLFSADELDGGLNSFPPPFFVQDMFFVWPDGVSGSFYIYLQSTPTTIVCVNFSADSVGVRFFEGFCCYSIFDPRFDKFSKNKKIIRVYMWR